jgi:hypothetical protein
MFSLRDMLSRLSGQGRCSAQASKVYVRDDKAYYKSLVGKIRKQEATWLIWSSLEESY